MIRKVSAEDIAIRGKGTGLEYMCPTRHFVHIFFNPVFQISTAKNEINLLNNHILIVAPVTFAPAGAMTPSAEFLFYIIYTVCLNITRLDPPSNYLISETVLQWIILYKRGYCIENWLLRQKAITTPMRKSLDKQYRETCICHLMTVFTEPFITVNILKIRTLKRLTKWHMQTV